MFLESTPADFKFYKESGRRPGHYSGLQRRAYGSDVFIFLGCLLALILWATLRYIVRICVYVKLERAGKRLRMLKNGVCIHLKSAICIFDFFNFSPPLFRRPPAAQRLRGRSACWGQPLQHPHPQRPQPPQQQHSGGEEKPGQ